ncbi:ABC transporter ATP-binding protein/permease [Hydrocarboniphaga sp.]|uniref:ABC transporter ATP-binding protein/permease n=1 Tax=Hydrocarboniphaga sp. TaxID=2033016 RepID=UPI003D100C13
MSDAAPPTVPSPAAAKAMLAQAGLLKQIGQLLGAVRASAVGTRLMQLAGCILVAVLATAYCQVRFNAWNKAFFDALSRRDFKDFIYQLGVFAVIVACLMILDVTQRWLRETMKVKLREGLVRDLTGRWMMPRRAFWLANAGEMGVNPDQRMTDDTTVLCNLSIDLVMGLLQATILFISFAGILWVLSEDFSFRVGDSDYAVPGFMLWAAILYAGFGSLLSYVVGRSLVARSANRYAREADLRFTLVRINEHLDGISLAAGEADERRRIEASLSEVMGAMNRLVLGWTNLTWVTAGFGWITQAAPILVAAPLFFSGKISLGGLVAAAAAFTQAQAALRWFVDNFSVIADWRATLIRVSGFRQALIANEDQLDFGSRITYKQNSDERLTLSNLHLESPAGRDMLQEPHAEIAAGERVLIVADAGTGKTLLFRALAGLWPWGSGEIANPAASPIYYMPRGTPYLPTGSLREILAYPTAVSAHDEAAFAAALARLDLERLVPMLDASKRWDRELSQDEQMSLAFARIVLQAPRWVLIDDAFGSLDNDTLSRVVDLFDKELAQTTLVHIGSAVQGHEAMFGQTLHLVKDAAAPRAAGSP